MLSLKIAVIVTLAALAGVLHDHLPAVNASLVFAPMEQRAACDVSSKIHDDVSHAICISNHH